MHVALFKALKSINVADAPATEVVDKLDGHVAVKISEATKGLEARLDAVKTQIDTTNRLITVIGFILTVIATIGAVAPIWLKVGN